MILEIRKRPFVRPLAVWIAGIVMQSFQLGYIFSFVFLFVPLLMFWKSERAYDARWLWGAIFLSLLLFLSVHKTAYHAGRLEASSVSVLQEKAYRLQQRAIRPLEHLSLSDAEKSVLATISLGAREKMPKEVRKQFSVTGVVHILAVSGFHVAIVCSFISWILVFLSGSRVGRWTKYLLTLALLWTFVLVSGLAASSVRAGIMLSLYLSGRQLYRTTDSYNTLAASAFCMLVYNPLYLFDVGFQLSYTAVWFILYLQPRLNKVLQVRNPLLAAPWSWLTVTLAAQIGVTFLCLYYFGYFSLVFIFTNLPLTLIATLLIPLTLLWMLLPAGLPGIELLQSGIEYLTRGMMWVVEAFSREGSSLSFRFTLGMLLLSYPALLSYLLYRTRHRAGYLLLFLFLCLMFLLLLLIDKYLHIKI
ncbi:competence protein ComEC [Parabacteroides sp. PF5-5]|uniref:ComEC/Rec2 family competence protein n=1 Tax=unclassified Parabacteroides TaxID=2649774 RepID=UPI002476E520|nr:MULTISPECIES: ComEC/Rec2 family competence protein [unclassified Parabacteroides]MDH6304709.1 competence protein ComEC [Parabacteroides sp. PH5-39]MDH6315676.1 competence protein ComEC [Parabacteroides sp. PF5-13]MDH6319337.1 competence protein ComEC [Parabacteroides sp. PH5-13]MDH6323068.1 competence protein ComEC [Parabacteroides sp. PH5-8]MDH6326869.1 competence protein ComEC [Parabacteroides sp. PH5-41]